MTSKQINIKWTEDVAAADTITTKTIVKEDGTVAEVTVVQVGPPGKTVEVVETKETE